MPNVNDIIGKGFKYEQVAEEQKIPATTGTVATILGAAHWGPINTPIRINNGLGEFRSRFGDVSSDYDEGHQAALYHYARSSRGYFTRITDGTETKSYYTVKADDTIASSVSNSVIAPDLVALKPGDNISINFTDTSDSINENVVVTFGSTALATVGYQDISNGGSLGSFTGATPSGLAAATYDLDVTINGALLHQLAITLAGTEDWDAVAAAIQVALRAATGSNETVAVVAGVIKISSITYGTTSTVLIAAGTAGSGGGDILTAISALGATYIATIDAAQAGLNSDTDAVLTQINAAIIANANLQAKYESANALADFTPASIPTSGTNINKLLIVGGGTGSDSSVTVTNSGGTFLTEVPMTSAPGTIGKSYGTFIALHPGRDGNRIRVIYEKIATENKLQIFFRDILIAQFVNVNFDFTLNDVNFVGNVINNDPTLKNVVEYQHAVDEAGVALSPAVLTTEIWPAEVDSKLSNGTSGDSTINVITKLVPEIAKYSNVDVYSFDLISTPGYYEEAAQDAIKAVNEARQDALGVYDTPMLSVTNVINWTNGLGALGRTSKIDDKYGAWYYPWLKVKKRVFSSSLNENTIADVLNDYVPTVRVIGAIAQADRLSGTTFAARAGIRTQMSDVEGFHIDVSNDDRKKLYGDIYDGIINPIGFTTEDGFTIEGQKTGLRKNVNGLLTAESRINVISTGLHLKREIYRKSKFFFWNPADPKSWSDMQKTIEAIMTYLEENRAIEPQSGSYPWSVKVDSANNTPLVTSNNGLVAEIEWYAIKTVEKIKVVSTILEKDVTLEFV